MRTMFGLTCLLMMMLAAPWGVADACIVEDTATSASTMVGTAVSNATNNCVNLKPYPDPEVQINPSCLP